MSNRTWSIPILTIAGGVLWSIATAQPAQPLRRLSLAAGATVIELESLAPTAAASAGAVGVQDMRGFGGGWSGGAQLFWAPPVPVDQPIRNWPHLKLAFTVPQAGTYRLVLADTVAPELRQDPNLHRRRAATGYQRAGGAEPGRERAATFLWYERPKPGGRLGHLLAHLEVQQDDGKWEAFNLSAHSLAGMREAVNQVTLLLRQLHALRFAA